MKSLKQYSPVRVGLIGAAIAGALVAGSTAFGTLGLTQDRYQAELANAAGVRAGDEVRVAGIGVGEVTRLRLDGDRVVMAFRVDREVELGRATRLSVKLSTLLGGRYVDLRPRGGGELPGDRIALSHTEVPFDIQSAIEAGTPALEELDGAKLRKALEVATDTFQDLDPQAAGHALDGLTAVSKIITKREDQIGNLLTNAEAVSRTLNANRAELFTLMGHSDRLLEELLRRRDLIAEMLTDFQALTKELHGLLKENRPQVKPLLKNLRGITGVLARNDKAIAESLTLFGPSARYLNNAAGNGPYLEMSLPYGIFPDNLLCQAGAVQGCR